MAVLLDAIWMSSGEAHASRVIFPTVSHEANPEKAQDHHSPSGGLRNGRQIDRGARATRYVVEIVYTSVTEKGPEPHYLMHPEHLFRC